MTSYSWLIVTTCLKRIVSEIQAPKVSIIFNMLVATLVNKSYQTACFVYISSHIGIHYHLHHQTSQIPLPSTIIGRVNLFGYVIDSSVGAVNSQQCVAAEE